MARGNGGGEESGCKCGWKRRWGQSWKGHIGHMPKSLAFMLKSRDSRAVLSRDNACSFWNQARCKWDGCAQWKTNQLMGRNFSILIFLTIKFCSVFDRCSFLSASKQQNEWTCSKRILKTIPGLIMLNSTVYFFFMDICACGYDFVLHTHNVDVFSASRSVLLKSVLFHLMRYPISIISWHSRKTIMTSSCRATWTSWRNCPLDGEEPPKGFEQGGDMNTFAILKGHSGSRLGRRLEQTAIEAIRTQEPEHCCSSSGKKRWWQWHGTGVAWREQSLL